MKREQFIKEIGIKMQHDMCDLFIGAGISAPSAIPTWKSFLGSYLTDLGLTLNDQDDLPLMAQHIVNANSGNRNIICGAIYDTFAKEYPLNAYHTAMTKFPIKTIWTTNYDSLLEKAFNDRKHRVIQSENTLLHPHDNVDLEIIKIHGCAHSAAEGIVLTRADYDSFLYNKPKISQRLREAIINKSILFLGYGYNDPNIQAIMAQAYQMMDAVTNKHYILLDEPIQEKMESDDIFKQREIRFKLWIAELNRIGICELVVPRSEIGDVLSAINKHAHPKSVFVTGGHISDEHTKEYAAEVGATIAAMKDVVLNNGQSSGIGETVLSAFMKYLVDDKQDINSRVNIFPNPYAISPEYADDFSLIPRLKKERMPLIIASTLLVVFPGNQGTAAEVDLARERDLPVIPVVADQSHYDTLAMKRLTEDSANMDYLHKYSDVYVQKLNAREIPARDEAIALIRNIIDGKA